MFNNTCIYTIVFYFTTPHLALLWALNESWSEPLCALNGRNSSQLNGRIISSDLCRFKWFYAAQLLRLQQIPWRYCAWKMKPLCAVEGSSHLTSRLKCFYQKYKGGWVRTFRAVSIWHASVCGEMVLFTDRANVVKLKITQCQGSLLMREMVSPVCWTNLGFWTNLLSERIILVTFHTLPQMKGTLHRLIFLSLSKLSAALI